MSSAARTKSKPKKDTAPSKKKEALKTGIRILVEDLRLGDHIVTSWHSKAEVAAQNGQALTDDEVMDLDGESSRYVNRSVEIKQVDVCPSQWRTHLHINKTSCYDSRQYIWIVKG